MIKPTWNCRLLLFAWLVLSWGVSNGQDYIDLARLYFQNTPNNNFKPATDNTKVREWGVELTAPIKIKPDAIWLFNLLYDHVDVKLFRGDQYSSLNSFTFRTGLVKNHSTRLTGTYLVVPRFSSDSNSPFRKGLQMGGLIVFKFIRNERSNFKAGLFVSSEFFSSFVTPLLGYYWISDDTKWEINALLPTSFNLNRKLSKKWDAGLNFAGQIKGYSINELPNTGGPGYLARTTNEVCGYLRYGVARNTFLMARFGISLGRSYRVYEERDKLAFAISFIKFDNTRSQRNTDFENGWVGQVGLLYRLPTQ